MKLGVVLAGGGCRAVFQAGVLYQLHQNGIRFDHVTGVSAGALNGCVVATRQIESLLEIWLSLAGSKLIRFRNSHWNFSPFNLSRIIYDLVHTRLSVEKLADSPVEFAVVTTRFPTFNREIYTNRQQVDMSLALRASSFFPILHTRPVYLDGSFQIDGCFRGHVPVDVAFERGCEQVVLIINKPQAIVDRQISPLRKKYGDRLIIFAPSKSLSIGKFDFREKKIIESFELGRQAAIELTFRESRTPVFDLISTLRFSRKPRERA